MKNKKLMLSALFFPIILLATWVAMLEWNLYNPYLVNVRVSGYDPRDLLKGHYIQLRPDWKTTDCKQFASNLCPSYKFNKSYKFYVPENKAKALDRFLAENQSLKFELVFVYKENEEPQIADFLIQGRRWKKHLLH